MHPTSRQSVHPLVFHVIHGGGGQKWYHQYGPLEHILHSIWREDQAPEVDENDDEIYLCQVCGKRETSNCSHLEIPHER